MRLIIVGASAYGRTIADIAEQSQLYSEILFLDDNCRNESVVGTIDEIGHFIDDCTIFYPAIGDNRLRCEIINRIRNLSGSIASIIHPSAYISPTSKLGEGIAVLPHASIGTNVEVGSGCIINMNSIVDHDCILEEGVHIAPGGIVKGENRISAYT